MVRRNILLYCKIFWQSKEIFIVIAGAFFFYVCFGRIIFYRKLAQLFSIEFSIETPIEAPSSSNYDTFADYVYNLFVTLTSSNYPDTYFPIYEVYRLSNLYWISFMSIVHMVLLSIILAFFYYNYKNELLEQANALHKSKSMDT